MLGKGLYLLEQLRDDLLETFNNLWVGWWWALAADHKVADIPARRNLGVNLCLPTPMLLSVLELFNCFYTILQARTQAPRHPSRTFVTLVSIFLLAICAVSQPVSPAAQPNDC